MDIRFGGEDAGEDRLIKLKNRISSLIRARMDCAIFLQFYTRSRTYTRNDWRLVFNNYSLSREQIPTYSLKITHKPF